MCGSAGLGDLLRSQKDYSGAALAYSLVDEITNPDPDLRQQADLAAGEVYDILHQRPQAVKKYEAVVALDGGNDRAAVARDRLKEPYRE